MTEQELQEIREVLNGGGFDYGPIKLTPLIERLLDEVERLKSEIEVWENRQRLTVQLSKVRGERIERLRKALEEIEGVSEDRSYYHSDFGEIKGIASKALEE